MRSLTHALLLFAVLFIIGLPLEASAQDEANVVCQRYTIIAAATRSLAHLGVKKDVTRAFVAEVYYLPNKGVQDTARQIIDAAYRYKGTSLEFAQAVLGACLKQSAAATGAHGEWM